MVRSLIFATSIAVLSLTLYTSVHAATSSETSASAKKVCATYEEAAWKGAELLRRLMKPLWATYNCNTTSTDSEASNAETAPKSEEAITATIYSKVKSFGTGLYKKAKSAANTAFMGFLDRQWERLKPSNTLEK